MRIDFYLLNGGQQQRLQFACRLADKVYRQNQQLAVLVEDQTAADELDQLMWSYQAESFLPHAVYSSDLAVPIMIYQQAADIRQTDVLLNLTANTVDIDCQRLLEILSSEPEVLAAGRARYKHYQQQGHQLQMHDLRG